MLDQSCLTAESLKIPPDKQKHDNVNAGLIGQHIHVALQCSTSLYHACKIQKGRIPIFKQPCHHQELHQHTHTEQRLYRCSKSWSDITVELQLQPFLSPSPLQDCNPGQVQEHTSQRLTNTGG